MPDTMPSDAGTVPSSFENPALALGLRTGYFDDRRQTIAPSDRRYPLFAQARLDQDDWGDDTHRRFWTTHLQLWRGCPGNRTNREALAFVLVMGRLDSRSYEETVELLPGRTWTDLRDREARKIADDMWKTVEGRTEPPGMLTLKRTDAGTSIPGPAHRDVRRALRRWRLPRVYAHDERGEEEKMLPPRLAGFINLPPRFGDRHAFEAIGDASLAVIGDGCGALNSAREVDGGRADREAQPQA